MNVIASLSKPVISPKALMNLPYFDFMAHMGTFPMHPGGGIKTQQLVDIAHIQAGDHVLEIGCGTGWTTQRLAEGGANITVLDNSERALQSAKHACQHLNIPEHKFVLGTAEKLPFAANQFDYVIYEAVLGFIRKPNQALAQTHRVLKKGSGKVGIIDFHYRTTPPRELQSSMADIFSAPIHPFLESDWISLFQRHFNIDHWERFSPGPITPPSVEHIRLNLENSDFLKTPSWDDADTFEQLSQRWLGWENVFAENRKYLQCHIALLSPQP